MRSMSLTGIDAMELLDVPEPRVARDTDVLIRVGAVGVCGSDVHYYANGRIGSMVVAYPFRVGHEFAGVVEQVGSAVTRVRPGDRVAVDPAMPCGACDQCRAGRAHTCRELTFLGCPGQAEGCLCDRIVMPEGCCFPLRDGMRLEQGAVSEPLSIGLYAVNLSIPMPGARIGILGCGPIGLSVLLTARAAGVERLYVTDKIDARLQVAAGAGADWTGNPDREDVVAAVAEREPLLLDAIFECCGEQDAIDQAVELLKPGGKLMLIGIPTVDRISFDIDKIRRKEICVQNVRRQNECTIPALDLMADGRAAVDFMITQRFSLEDAQQAFDLVAGYRDGVVKAMIHVSEDE